VTPTLVAGLSGLLFGVGLMVSGMTRPDKVVAFLDLTGDWDPSLALVMLGAIGVHALAYRLVPRLGAPALGGRFGIPTRRDVDVRLLAGAALFGAGWGLSGYCPGPAVTSAATGTADVLIVLGAMFAGMAAHRAWERWAAPR